VQRARKGGGGGAAQVAAPRFSISRGTTAARGAAAAVGFAHPRVARGLTRHRLYIVAVSASARCDRRHIAHSPEHGEASSSAATSAVGNHAADISSLLVGAALYGLLS
jgi:hypothetical protein